MGGFGQSPMWSLGFRPFYLLGAAFAVLSLPLWLAAYTGTGDLPARASMAWHAHEMVFGFAAAIITGFLFTAVRSWTGQPTPAGAVLAGLAALWLLARILQFTGPMTLAAVVDVLFLPAVGVAIALPILRSRNARNYKVLVIVAVLALLNLCQHLAGGGAIPMHHGRTALLAALDVIAILMAVMGGRVIPAFTGNAVPGARLQRVATVEWAALGSMVLLLVAGLARHELALPAGAWAGLAAFCALAHAVRLWLWHPLQTRHNALLWMLPAGYVWIVIAYALRAAGDWDLAPPILAVHALTVGAMGSLMMAMMMRSTLGHSGRPLQAGPWDIAAFLAVQGAAIVRVFGALALPSHYVVTVVISGVLWSAAFALFLLRYGPLLVRPREG